MWTALFQRSLLPSSSGKSSHSYYITLRMEAVSSSETFVHICQSIQCHSTWWKLSNSLLQSCLHTNQLSCSFCNLVHLPNKLFLMVCCYKTQLLFYLQKFTLNFSQNHLDLCRFWVQDRQIRGLMKVGKRGGQSILLYSSIPTCIIVVAVIVIIILHL